MRESVSDNVEFNEICQINVDSNEENNIDVTHIKNREHRETIKKLINEYEPEKTREVGLKMTIILRDDEPVYQRARRLSLIEKEQVNAQGG